MGSIGKGTTNFDFTKFMRKPDEKDYNPDTIITVDNKLEAVNGRNLDELDYLAEVDSRDIISSKTAGQRQFDNISIEDIKKYLLSIKGR